MKSIAFRIILAMLALLLLGAGLVFALNLRGETPVNDGLSVTAVSPQTIERGAYLARAGNCAGCHTAAGGAEYAGGRAIETPFGTVYSSNLTSDKHSGLGAWGPDAFWRALHHGRSRDGRLLYPAFPYPSFSKISREDSDALLAFLHTVPAVAQGNRRHDLRGLYGSQVALAIWRAVYFRPAGFENTAGKSAEWNRGAYLVQGLGHCGDCHSPRGPLGGLRAGHEFEGGLMPLRKWYAPSLLDDAEGSVRHWPKADVVALLRKGIAPGASVLGPMAEVVRRSTQFLSDADLDAMASYLMDLPGASGPRPVASLLPAAPGAAAPVDEVVMLRGKDIYQNQCKDCHGPQGQGASGAYPALAGNRAVTMKSPVNVLKVLISGGFTPVTAGNPRPFGMPPFSHALADSDIAAVATYIRRSWGNGADEVSAVDVVLTR